MAYGTIKVDTITFTDGGIDKSVAISGLVQNPTCTGNVTATGTISGDIVRGQTISGVTVTGTTAQFTSGTFVSLTGTTLQGTTATYTTGSFTSLTGTTTSGTTANFVSGVFSTQISGVTVTGTTANFTSGNFTNISGGTHTITSGVFALGTEANPSISFVSDPNSGLFSPGADQVAISTNGTGRLFVNANGNVGVGTSNVIGNASSVYLTVNGSTLGGIALKSADSTVGYLQGESTLIRLSSDGAIPITFDTNGSERLRIDSSGRLGLGTSSPAQLLETQDGNIQIRNSLTLSVNTLSPYGLTFRNANQLGQDRGTIAEIKPYLAGAGDNDFGLQFRTQATTSGGITTKMTLTPGGSLGIGTTSPASIFHVKTGTDANFVANNGGAGSALRLMALNDAGTNNTNLQLQFDQLIFAPIGTERARIDSSGRLLVGTSSYAANSNFAVAGYNGLASGQGVLDIVLGTTRPAGADSAIGSIRFTSQSVTSSNYHYASISAISDGASSSDTDIPGRLVFSTTADGASSSTEAMRITSSQNIRIGTTAEGSGFSAGRIRLVGNTGGINGLYTEQDTAGGYSIVSNTISNGGTYYHVAFFEAGTQRGSITSNGSATAYNTSSDYRLKENVVPLTGAADRLNQLQVHRFNFTADPDKTVDGFLAHEAQAVVPECVTGTKDEVDGEGNPVYQGIDQSKLVPLLTAALQEALAEIESLKARVTALEP
jgi:hypothetical protein